MNELPLIFGLANHPGIAALLVLVLGVVLARLSSSLVAYLLTILDPRLVYGVVLAIAVVMGLQQMGVDISFVTQLMLALLIVILGDTVLVWGETRRVNTGADILGRLLHGIGSQAES